MKIQIYHNKNYIPFNLYIGSIYNIFKTNDYFVSNNYDVSIINNINQYSHESDYLILYLNYIEDIYNIDTKNTKIIFIHADYIINHSKNDQYLMCNYINNINLDNSYLWEYNYLNVEYYNSHFTNKKWTFIPLLYNNYLEKIYNKKNIPYERKPIDILFTGAVDSGSRRELMLEKLSKIYKVFIMKNVNDINEYIELVENSKIILHIYAKDINCSFDYYRLALLYSNKVFVISETYKEVNPENSHKLEELSKVLIESNYDDLSNKTEEYLNKSTSEIDTITQQTYDVFKKNTLDESIIKFFSEHI
jgi:hypothetical protein